MKFHKRVPSFSFTSFTFNNNNSSSNNNEQPEPVTSQSHSQPSSPSQPHFEVQPTQEPPASAVPLSTNSLSHQQQETPRPSPNDQQLAHRPRNGSITLLLSPDDPLRFIVQSTKACSPRKRSGSLVEQSMSSPTPDQSDASGSGRRRSSFAEPVNQPLTALAHLDRGRIASPNRSSTLTQSSSNSNSSTSHFTRHRKRLSNLFSPLSYYSNNSRSPSPANRTGRLRQSSHSVDPESDRESTLDSSSIHPQIDLPSSSEDESDSNHSNSDQSSDLEPELTDPEAETILANTNANASSITPIDYLQKSNQPIPFIDQAPNITSPPPLPISFAPTDPRSLSKAVIAPNRKTSTSSRAGSIRRRTSLGPRQDLKLTVSRPIYQKNRCTITIEHGDWLEVAKKAERTRFYLVACDLSDESKYAIEWTIGTVLRQGDECLVIMIIETDSKFDPEEGPGSAADRTAKIRNQKDRQEKATLLVREVTALLERTGLHAKVTCQAIHGKNAKHMLVDCIDYLEPNLVIVGRRGETSSKGSLMGSVSHYLVQKSSVPVMVARRRLRTLPKVYKKKSGIVPTAQQQRKLNEAAIEKSLTVSSELHSPDSKRLSVVSEETEKLNLQGFLLAAESSPLDSGNTVENVDQDKKDDHSDQKSDGADLDEERKEVSQETEQPGDVKQEQEEQQQDEEGCSQGKQKEPVVAQEVQIQAHPTRHPDPVITAHPVSILEPVA
ncbi:uncharacterized protein PGTG_03589 [Puccinia graminis f. sp. tritici CRL 75-36-700-3]|uniref:UspA domain-containing protein n=1 Tax=Puccinia graminis f. sp. tritici (strain CRL 75-36-700-3 / race SCCL) TaxID=418459 RepID=E3K008_PUCGT|nr:uncharacterized protein PGTG_03589 [Puccinia graminis f. sp. tritici CRL 75-36-700-3]EFP77633.2 hypothetical protein PGTG_03589 [Puccinia graminis f. sp. tritici CRL 75-36-700-3]